ncbi:MAG: DUF5011 domain-containing protein, partial [Bacteroidetes bacterium]|nr:DUF5011 domain-containing protein [Bacteroidota bacterium]
DPVFTTFPVPTPNATNTQGGIHVVYFTLIDADSDVDLFTITNNMNIDFSMIDGMGLSIRANTHPSIVGSVSMDLSGPVNKYKKENAAPYALWGDTQGGGDYTPGPAFQLGTYTMEAIAYENSNLNGQASTPLVITFNVVNVTDTVKPVITLLGDNPVDLIQGQTYSEAGATASDNLEGDISGNLVIDASAVNTNVVGSYSVTYNVSDQAGNAATEVIRTVNVNPDTVAPVITLIGDNPVELVLGQFYIEEGATASDDINGDISGDIIIDASAVDTDSLGSYQVTYNVSDQAGNAAVQVVRVVNVNEPAPDTTAPVITLLGANPVDLTIGDTYIEAGATALDDIYGDITLDIVIDASAVNTSVVGVYNVTYNVSDPAGNAALEVIRVVNVNPDTTAPVIVLLGQNPVILPIGTPYTESGAIAMDDVDGDLSSSIIIDASSVDVNVAGVYTVTYNVSDLSGNAADEVTRTVTVNDEQCLFEIGGEVVIEAENFTNSTFGTGSASGSSWEVYTDGTASQGSAVRAIPNTGVLTRGNANGPRLDYEVDFTTLGTYRLWVRLGAPSSNDNSIHA